MNIYVCISKEKQKGCVPNKITFRGVRFGRMGEDYFCIINRYIVMEKKQKEPKWKNLKGSTENGL